MTSRTVTIINKLGLHARSSAKFVQTASTFGCDISIKHNGQEVNGKSIMGVMMLAICRDTKIEIVACGHDEKQALDTLEALVINRLGEDA